MVYEALSDTQYLMKTLTEPQDTDFHIHFVK